MTMRDRSTIGPDATHAVDAPGADHGVCVSTVDGHGRRENSDGKSSKYEYAHSCLLWLGSKLDG